MAATQTNMEAAKLNLGAVSIGSARTAALRLGDSSATAGSLRLCGATGNKLPKLGTGTSVLTLSRASTYAAGTKLDSGTLSFAGAGLVHGGNIMFSVDSSPQSDASTTTDLASRFVRDNGLTASLDVGANPAAFAADFGASSSGALTKSNSGNLTLSDANNHTASLPFQLNILNLTCAGRPAARHRH